MHKQNLVFWAKQCFHIVRGQFMVSQIIQILFETFKAVGRAFFELLPLAQTLSDLKTRMIELALGISIPAVTLIGIGIRLLRKLHGHR